MRLIDADELYKLPCVHGAEGAWICLKDIHIAPTVDAVKHGEWINDKGIYKCSVCNTLCAIAGWASCIPKKQMYEVFKFCPECGARMNEVEDVQESD